MRSIPVFATAWGHADVYPKMIPLITTGQRDTTPHDDVGRYWLYASTMYEACLAYLK